MLDYRREFSEVLVQLVVNFVPDGSGSILLLWRRHPAGNDVVGINLGRGGINKRSVSAQ